MADEIKTTNGRMRTISPTTYDSLSENAMLPSFELMQKYIPESEEWEVGEDYKIEILVTQKSVRSKDNGNCVEFQIKKIKALN